MGVIGGVLALALAATANASGGSGGGVGGGVNSGGINRHGGSYGMVYAPASTSYGPKAACIGNYNLTTYVTTLRVDWKCTNVNLPDGSLLYTYVLTNDYFTGNAWAPMFAGVTSLAGGKAVFTNPNVVTTGVNGLPVMKAVVIVAEDGSIVFTGVPG